MPKEFANCDAFITAVEAQCPATQWDYIALYDTEMGATDLNPFLYCLATKGKRPSTGYEMYDFTEWENEASGALDQDVLEALVSAAPALYEYYVDKMGCSKTLQSSLLDLGTMLVKGNTMMYLEFIGLIKLDA